MQLITTVVCTKSYRYLCETAAGPAREPQANHHLHSDYGCCSKKSRISDIRNIIMCQEATKQKTWLRT